MNNNHSTALSLETIQTSAHIHATTPAWFPVLVEQLRDSFADRKGEDRKRAIERAKKTFRVLLADPRHSAIRPQLAMGLLALDVTL